jgi:hypothetical protein
VALRLQTAAVTREQLLRIKEILTRHQGPVPAFLHFLHPETGEAILALPEELALSPSSELATEINALLGYPALSL